MIVENNLQLAILVLAPVALLALLYRPIRRISKSQDLPVIPARIAIVAMVSLCILAFALLVTWASTFTRVLLIQLTIPISVGIAAALWRNLRFRNRTRT